MIVETGNQNALVTCDYVPEPHHQSGEYRCSNPKPVPATQPAPAGGEWALSSAMTNDIIYRNNFGKDGMKPVCIDIPEVENGRTHYAAVIVCTGKQTAAQIVAEHNAVVKLADTLRLTRGLLLNQVLCERSLCESCQTARQTVLDAINFALTATTTQPDAGEGRER